MFSPQHAQFQGEPGGGKLHEGQRLLPTMHGSSPPQWRALPSRTCPLGSQGVGGPWQHNEMGTEAGTAQGTGESAGKSVIGGKNSTAKA